MKLLFIWYLLAIPSDKFICSLWTPSLDEPAIVQACGMPPSAFQPDWIYRVWEYESGVLICDGAANELPVVGCQLDKTIENYRLGVYRPNWAPVLCVVKIEHSGQPSVAEMAAQCPSVSSDYTLTFNSMRAVPPPDVPHCQMPPLMNGTSLYELPTDPSELESSEPFALLAGRLLWWGLAQADCEGWSGLLPEGAASECGLTSAMPQVLDWQNQFDNEIYQAGARFSVPPKLLKSVMGLETQFWPFTGVYDEYGLIQLTALGADVALRYSPALFDTYCPRALYPARCEYGYDYLDLSERALVVQALRADIYVSGMPVPAAVEIESDIDIYAQVLAAYYCYAGEISAAPNWENAMAVFNAGSGCTQNGDICESGEKYLRTLKWMDN